MKVSVVILTWNGEDTVEECLHGVFSQKGDFELDVVVIDSSSTDSTLEIVARFPARVRVIDQRDFDHGDTRNMGAWLTDGELIVYLVQDAYPLRDDWLATLVRNFEDERIGGVFCRILPRPTAGPLVRRGVEGDLNGRRERIVSRVDDEAAYLAQDPLARRIFVNFNDVASCVRRTAWQRLPFPRVPFGEDLLWAKGALEAGYAIVFEPDAPVVHSHEYVARTLARRTAVDAWLNRAYLDRICIRRRRHALAMTARAAKADRQYVRAFGIRGVKGWKLAAVSFLYHFLEFWGFFRGGQTPDRLLPPRATRGGTMKVLFVVHGFPPETTAGTEVLTLTLAKALARRGHEVVVFHRVADPSRANYSVDEGTLDDLRVIRVTNHLRFRSIGETYRCPEVEERFREVLDREKPDVVHFEHLIHLSATLVSVCREKGVPSVVTLNDYWFRCPKIQLIRSDGSVCSGPPPILGCAACVGGMPRVVSLLAILSRPFRRALASLASRYLDLVRRSPGLFRGVLSDVAYIAKRPGTLIDELLAADFVIAPSRFLKGKAVEAGLPAGRLVVSDYGMETDWLPGYRRTEEKGRVRFGFIGSLVPHKGLGVLASAFQRLDDPRAELHVHGDTEALPVFRETRERAAAKVTRGGLSFHGRYEPRDVGRVLGSIDVLVVPSVWYECSPLVVHEGFLAKVPVLVSDLGAMKDLVAEGRGGLRFRAGDDADLARVMRRFLDEEDLAKKLAAAAPPVKTADENAAEMEVKYRQAIGLRAAHSPFLEVAPEAFRAARGQVLVQEGRALLLHPVPGGSSAVHEFATDGAVTVELRLSLLHLAGEGDVAQGGEIRLDGRVVLRVGPTAGGDRERVETRSVPVRLGKGRHRIEVRNRVRGPGGGTWTARLLGLSLHRTPTPVPREGSEGPA